MRVELLKRYLFVLGKNQRLSTAEIASYLRIKGLRFEMASFKGFCIAETEDGDIDVKDLGGTLKVCEVLGESLPGEFEQEIMKAIPPVKSRKGYFAVSIYGPHSEGKGYIQTVKRLSVAIKKRLREEGSNLNFMSHRGRSYFTHTEIVKKKVLVDGFELVAGIVEGKCYIARTLGVHDPFEFMKRDVERPAQRTMYSIPPRLALIMLNLSEPGSEGLVIDPFCGVGTIVQEMALRGLECEGSDIDADIIEAARTNLDWLKGEYKTIREPKLFAMDARELGKKYGKESVSRIVTEPSLGPLLPKHPKKRHVEKIVEELLPQYREFFEVFREILKEDGKVIIVFPEYRTEKGDVRIETGFLKEAGFEKVPLMGADSFLDAEERHRVMRRIYVLRRK
ncbi:hypothetical protein A3K63_00165 [Candidatus Micrarchaeota archaeon RBG_16_49_10]|nr:MAG: hypothetical protein A3K63_00165 [Candidatus Micrarchaeota archaeon RBG_16_49_10]